MTLHCVSCDAIRDVARAFCGNCNEVTDSYTYTPDYSDELYAPRVAVMMGFQVAECGGVSMGEGL